MTHEISSELGAVFRKMTIALPPSEYLCGSLDMNRMQMFSRQTGKFLFARPNLPRSKMPPHFFGRTLSKFNPTLNGHNNAPDLSNLHRSPVGG